MRSVTCLVLLTLSLGILARTADSQAPQKKFVVGALLPLSGTWQNAGTETRAALELALQEINAYLAPRGCAIELTVCDTASDPAVALTKTQELKAAGVRAVIGPLTSDEASTILDFANSNDMLLLSPSSTAPSLAKEDNLFRLCPDDTNQARAMVMLMKQEGIVNAVPVYADDPYGRDLQRLFCDRFVEQGGKVQGSVMFPVTNPDYGAVVREIEAAVSQVDGATAGIFVIGSDEEGANLLRHAAASPVLGKVRWYAGESIAGYDSLVQDPVVGAVAAQVGLKGFTLSREDEYFHLYAHLIMQRVATVTGVTPTPFVAPAWDALWLAARTYQAVPDADFATFKKTLLAQSVNFFGVLGFCELDKNGDKVAARYALAAVKGDGAGGYAWRVAGTYVDEPYGDPQLTIAELPLNAAPAEEATVIVGALLPFSGPLGDKGAEARAALLLAVEHINAYLAGKASGLRLALAVEDTQAGTGGALERLQALEEQQACPVIAFTLDSDLASMEGFIRDKGIPVVSPCSGAVSLAKQDTILRLVPNDGHLVKAIAAVMAKQGITQESVIHQAGPYGEELSAALGTVLSGVVTNVAYTPGQPDFAAVFQQTSDAVTLALSTTPANTVAVLVAGFDELPTLLKRIPPEGPLTQVGWYGTEYTLVKDAILSDPDAAAAARRVSFTGCAYGLEGFGLFLPQVESLNALLSPALGRSLSSLAVNTYDALWIIARAYERLGAKPEPAQLSSEMEKQANKMYGMSGPTFLDINGDRLFSAYAFYAVTGGDGAFAWKLKALYRDAAFASDVVLMP